MKILKRDQAQQEMLEHFYREWMTWCPEHVEYQLCAAIFIGISMIFSIVPCQIWDFSEDAGVFLAWIALYLLGIVFDLQKYNNYKENGKVKATCHVLRYVPVSRKQFYLYQMRKIWKLCGWLTGISIGCRSVFAGAFLHDFSIGNILIPFGINFILPMLIVGILSAVRM